VRRERRWLVRAPSQEATRLALQADIPLLQARLLINRGVSDAPSARRFIAPRLADLLHPMLFKDMTRAVDLILECIERKHSIAVFGDYDADGLTATALLKHFFNDLGIPVAHYLPNRFRDGYGLNRAAVESLSRNGTLLLITVDCGTSNSDEILMAKGLGLEVVVTDHHQVPEGFAPGCPVINPHQRGCPFPDKHLAGVGVAFFLVMALRLAMRARGWFASRPEPDLKPYLDLVAVGTVSDRVPLVGQNRILVQWGMRVMETSRWQGLKALMSVSGITPGRISSDDLAFRLGPRLNAPGRVDDPETGLRLLCAEDPESALRLARQVGADNSARQRMEQELLEEIHATVEGMDGIGRRRTLVIAGNAWPQGILGIVASRVVDRYHRPALVFSLQDGTAVGSGRSIQGFHLHHALSRMAHLFERFGGHAHAAGFRTTPACVELLKEEFENVARSAMPGGVPVPTLHVDARISLGEIDPGMLRQIEALAPFGEGNPEPQFLVRSLRVLKAGIVGANHLKLRVTDGGRTLEAIGFGMGNRYPLGSETIDMILSPQVHSYQGNQGIQLRIVDMEAGERASGLLLEDPGGQFDVFRAEDEEGFLSPGQG
jgi:single-stranded-DNA-specific exonuclease